MTRRINPNATIAGVLGRRTAAPAPAAPPPRVTRVARVVRPAAPAPAPAPATRPKVPISALFGKPKGPAAVSIARPEFLDPVTIADSETLVTELIKRSRVERREARDKDYLHVSDLLNRCVRKLAIDERYSLPQPPQQLSFMDSLTFAQGDAIAEVSMRRLGIATPEMLWGKWRCKCKYLHIDTPCVLAEVDLSDICERCGTACDTYVEVSQFDEEYKIVGNPDLLLYFAQQDAFHIGELKSIAHKQFEELVRPKPEHVAQALFYWWIMHRKGMRLSDRVSIFYVTKGYVFVGDPYREFSIHAPSSIARLNEFLRDALAVKTFRAGGDLPSRVRCASALSPDAKKCPACDICFAGELNAN